MLELFKGSNVRLALLEERLHLYEELSKEMLLKLETAVEKISEANQNVAKILVRHEERLDKTIQADQQFVKVLEELKNTNEKKIDAHKKELDDLVKKVEDLFKFRWLVAGGLAVAVFLGSHIDFVEVFTPDLSPDRVQTKP